MTKATADIRSLARAQTALAIRTLTGVCGSKAAPAAARVSAASALLDRGWGKPQQDGNVQGEVRVSVIDDVIGLTAGVLNRDALSHQRDAFPLGQHTFLADLMCLSITSVTVAASLYSA